MSVVGSYEINLEDEYDPVGVPPTVAAMAVSIILLISLLILALVGVYVYRRMRRR